MIASDPTVNGTRNPQRSPSSDSLEFGEGPSIGATGTSADEKRPDPLGPLLGHLAELREYLGVYCAARIDQWRISARGIAFKVVFGLIGALFGITAAIVAIALLVNGLATGIGILCGGQIWIGQIIVGGMLMLTAFGGLLVVMRSLRIVEHRRVVDKYETRKRRERSVFGTDVGERAAQRDPE
jgi:hypothetical protein